MSERWGSSGRRRALIGVCVLCALAGAAAPTVRAIAWPAPSPAPAAAPLTRTFQATSLAIPTQQNPVATGSSVRLASTDQTSVHVVTTATESSTCDSCRGQAVTMQVVYAEHGMFVTADNAAAAWSANCAHCAGSALSLQIVVTRAPTVLSANNRALALNAACVQCRTDAAAVQIVVRARSAEALSPRAMTRLRALRADLLTSLAAAPPAAAVRGARISTPAARAERARTADAIQATVSRMQSVVSTDLGAISASHRIVIR